MIVEFLRVQCGCGNTLTGLFDNHHSAIVAGERAGWLMQSESIGGDQCPRCLGREGNAADDWRAYDETVAEQWHANIELKRERDEARAERNEAIARGVELWEYAADVTGWYDSALALVDLHEQWEAEAQKERDEARAELKRIFEHLPERHLYAVRDCPPGQGTSHAVALCVDELCDVIDANEDLRRELGEARASLALALRQRDDFENERDEARAEVERLTQILTQNIDERLAAEIAERERMADSARLIANDFLFEARRERDEARAEVERLKVKLQSSAYMRVKGQRDEARDEVNVWRDWAGEIGYLAEGTDHELRAAVQQRLWDTNANGAIDDADELAAYAEASDLRALAEREAVTEGGDDGL